ncbi:efflux transporter, outer membrane factor (OMF) lipoprotein, NodT family [Hymenobacter arizonensis]|uniref:Efflux transporter, outer membrane factor (OMF) lipoprotein, NodT family n=1 Tax=Hymenobacter arizonensis TaxID=1227077 RepID=A0A1I6AIE6_HYMAR|nr:efflux transporter, outer membrane factor (OMF) lipoprotein, NodT family [Hymenobacter arizonensis]
MFLINPSINAAFFSRLAPPLPRRGGRGVRRTFAQLLVVSLITIFTGCQSVAPPVITPRATATPSTFASTATPTTTDTLTLAKLPWRRFFGDSALVTLIDTALHANPDLLVAVQRVEIARAGLLAARGALLPSASVGAVAGFDRFADYAAQGQTSTNDGRELPNGVPNFSLGLQSAWEIDLWGKLRNRRQAAFARVLASEQGRRLVQTALIAQVASLYYELLTYDNQLAVLGKNRALQERAVEIVKLQKLGGRATELAVQQFTAQLLRTRSLEIEARQRIAATENTLNRLLGRYPQPIRRGLPLNLQQLPAQVAAGLPTTMLLRRPDVQQAELELVASRADVAAARAAFLPSLTLGPYIGLNAYSPALLFQTPGSLAFGLLGGLSAPLLNRSLFRADYRRSAAQQRAAYWSYQKAVQTGFEEVTTNLNGLENYRRVADLRQQEVAALTRAVDVSNDLYRANYANYLEVVTAQRSVLDAELILTDTRRQQFLLLIDLYRALGGGWDAQPTADVR